MLRIQIRTAFTNTYLIHLFHICSLYMPDFSSITDNSRKRPWDTYKKVARNHILRTFYILAPYTHPNPPEQRCFVYDIVAVVVHMNGVHNNGKCFIDEKKMFFVLTFFLCRPKLAVHRHHISLL